MDEFYIVKLWVFLSPVDDIGHYPTLEDAETGLKSAIEERRRHCSEEYDAMGEVGYSINHMVNHGSKYLEDEAAQVIYDHKGDIIKDVLMCKTCSNAIKLSGKWVSHSDELAYEKSNGETCGRCCDATLDEIEVQE